MTVRNRWLALIPSVISGVLLLIVGLTNGWSFVGVPSNGTNFGDLRVITTAAQCAAADPSWSIASTPCDPTMAMYNYPSFWARGFALLAVTPDSTTLIAVVLILAFLIGLTFITHSLLHQAPSTLRILSLMSFAAISPPVLLAAQRGNIDLVVFGFMACGLALYASVHRYSGAVALAIATALKLFPIGSGLALLFDAGKRLRVFLVFIVVSLIGITFSFGDLRLISEKTPQLDGASFGSSLLPFLIASHSDSGLTLTAFKLFGWVIFLAVFCVLYLLCSKAERIASIFNSVQSELSFKRSSAVMFLGSAGTFLVAYLIGPSFDYRLIFLIPAIGAFSALRSRISLWIAIVILAQLVLSYSTFIGSAQYLSDLMLLVLAPLLAVMCVRLIRSPEEQSN